MQKKLCVLLIKNKIDVTKIDEEDEHLLHTRQTRDHGSIVDYASHANSRNQTSCTLENIFPLKRNGKHVCAHVTNATKHEIETLSV